MQTADKYLRTLRILLAHPGAEKPLVLTDWKAGQPVEGNGRWCSFTVQRHSRPEPQIATIEVQGLHATTRSRIVSLHKEAEEQAFRTREVLGSGKVSIFAGYGDDAGLLFVGDLAPDGVKVRPGNPQPVLTLRAMDGRIAWEGRYVKKSLGPGIDVRTISGVLAAAGDFMEGKTVDEAFEQQFPELVKRTDGPAAFEGGFVMFGPSRKANRQLCRDLRIQPFFVDGEVVYVSQDTTILGEAVTLVRGRTLQSAEETGLGRYTATCLLDHRFRPGRQINLREADEKSPIGAGTFRLDEANITGSMGAVPFNATLLLRPTVK